MSLIDSRSQPCQLHNSSRKRKNSLDSGTQRTLSKRAKLLSSLWQSQEEIVGATQSSQSNPSSPVYRIKAIIGERPFEYQIDWADDPITGEKFKPDWVGPNMRHVFLRSTLSSMILLFASSGGANGQLATQEEREYGRSKGLGTEKFAHPSKYLG